jgi:hypothetical protein
VRDEGPVPGLSDIIPAAGELTAAQIEGIARAVSDADLPVQETLGLPVAWAFLARSFSERRLLRELPDEERSLPWFEIHVPPGGTSLIRLATKTSAATTASLSVFGSGLGKGRTATITVGSASEPRSVCASYHLNVRVRTRIYTRAGIESVEVEVREFLGESVEPLMPCPRCRTDGAMPDPSEYRLEPYIDLRRDSVASRVTSLIEIDEETTIDAGFSVASLSTALKLSAVIKRGVTLETESMLPPGHRYWKFHRLALGAPLHSPMWAVND